MFIFCYIFFLKREYLVFLLCQACQITVFVLQQKENYIIVQTWPFESSKNKSKQTLCDSCIVLVSMCMYSWSSQWRVHRLSAISLDPSKSLCLGVSKLTKRLAALSTEYAFCNWQGKQTFVKGNEKICKSTKSLRYMDEFFSGLMTSFYLKVSSYI